jgi:hypothetical protein
MYLMSRLTDGVPVAPPVDPRTATVGARPPVVTKWPAAAL